MTADLATLAAAHPAIAFEDARLVETGWDFVVVDTGRWVFRLPRAEWAADHLRVERRLLALLGPRLPVPVPEMSLHSLADGTPYALYPRLPGTPSTCAEAAAVAGDVAAFLTALHATEPADALILGLDAPGKLDLDVLARRATAEVVPLLPWASVSALHEAFAVLREPVPVETVVHADLGEANLLVAGGRLTGVLDWSDAHVGDPAMDLTWFVQCLGVAGAREALAAYAPPDGVPLDALWRRAFAHAVVQPVHAVLWGLDHGRPSYVARQLARIGGVSVTGPR
ncbi:MAG TPA: phosphotransferase [Mycobacteriales bacterium]|jgi:aminoglycoside phosphotransferase (APT) family kinase protein